MKYTTILRSICSPTIRDGIRRVVEHEAGLCVVGDAYDGLEAVTMACQLRPAIVLMDLAIPILSGLEATRRILEAHPATKVLIVTEDSSDSVVHDIFESGAVGVLLKELCVLDTCRAIRSVQEGETFTNFATVKQFPRLNPQLPNRAGVLHDDVAQLTSRELDVLQRIAEGEPLKQIAVALEISVPAVKRHRSLFMKKLGIYNDPDLARYALGVGIIENRVRLTVLQ